MSEYFQGHSCCNFKSKMIPDDLLNAAVKIEADFII